MQVTVETTNGLERKMHVVVPAEQIDSQVNEKIKQTAQKARINGFRPGKVPMREIKRRFGVGIRQEVSSEVIQASYGQALQQESISPAGMPSIEEVKMEAGQDLEFTAVFEVFPEVVVGGFESISIERPVSSVEESDIDEMIETLREQRMEYEVIERASVDKDKVKVDFEGSIDGVLFDGGKAEGADLILGSGSMIPGFEEGLVGLSAGDEKDLEVTFPESYQAQNLAGKTAIFKTKVLSVSEPKKPMLDDEFFKLFDVAEGGVEAFREEVKGNMERELDAAIKAKLKDQVMEGIVKSNEVDLPKALIQQEIDRMRKEAVQQFGGNAQIDPSMLPAEMFTEQSERRVKLGLLVSRIVEEHEVKPDDDKVRELIDVMASSYEDPQQVISYYYSNEQELSRIQNMVLEQQIVDLVVAKASVSDKTMSYAAAIKRDEPVMPESSDKAATAADDE